MILKCNLKSHIQLWNELVVWIRIESSMGRKRGILKIVWGNGTHSNQSSKTSNPWFECDFSSPRDGQRVFYFFSKLTFIPNSAAPIASRPFLLLLGQINSWLFPVSQIPAFLFTRVLRENTSYPKSGFAICIPRLGENWDIDRFFLIDNVNVFLYLYQFLCNIYGKYLSSDFVQLGFCAIFKNIVEIQ